MGVHHLQGIANGSDVAGQNSIVQVMHGNVKIRGPESRGNGLQGGGEEEWPKGGHLVPR